MQTCHVTVLFIVINDNLALQNLESNCIALNPQHPEKKRVKIKILKEISLPNNQVCAEAPLRASLHKHPRQLVLGRQ